MEITAKHLTSEPIAFLALIAGAIAIAGFYVETRNRTDDNAERRIRVENDVRESRQDLRKLAANMAEAKADVRNIFTPPLSRRHDCSELAGKAR